MIMKKSYIRDGRAPIPKREITSRIMSAIRAKNTKPELLLKKVLSANGLKGYRSHCKNVPGRPDICWPKKKIAIFVNGCYWHRHKRCAPKTPKTHKVFWKKKFADNTARDKRKIKALRSAGWRVLNVWECQLKNDLGKTTSTIIRKVNMILQAQRKSLKVIELFAGVGGFRLGLERVNNGNGQSPYETVWFNQWEPSSNAQHAWDIYVRNFYNGTKPPPSTNTDITSVQESEIPAHDLLVGGFPCQDYSVARTLRYAKGIVGKKGVLWWQIERIIREKAEKNDQPSFLMLENVDRLLKSPASQRGRDFALMLASLSDLDYIVEWRVINAADYGMPQRRRRIFIVGYHARSEIAQKIRALERTLDWSLKDGVMAKAFPIKEQKISSSRDRSFELKGSLVEITKDFNKGVGAMSPFENAGIMIDRKVRTFHAEANYEGKRILLKDILLDEKDVPGEFFIDPKDLPDWKYLKGAKREERGASSGFKYSYNEGPVAFPDPLNKPSRTIITGEGGPSPSRFKHVVECRAGKLRRLTPVELEKLNQFPPNHTAGIPDTRRAFLMGNALVTGVVEKLGIALKDQLAGYDETK